MGKQARTLIEALEHVADSQKTGYAYMTAGGAVHFESFHELYRRASRIGLALQAHGCTKGDRLGMVLLDAQQFIDSFFGALMVGVVPVPISPPPARFGQPETYLHRIAPIVAKARPRLLLTDSYLETLLGQRPAAFPSTSPVTLEALLQHIGVDEGCTPADIRPEDTAFLQFTSGSTAHPKGAQLHHANLVANIRGIAEYGLQATPDDYCVSWLPLYHDMGLIGKVFVPLYAGMRGVLFMPTALFLKQPLSWLRQISRQQGTITFAPNFAYHLCITRTHGKIVEGLDLSSLRIAGCGAEPIRYEVLAAFARQFKPCGFRPAALLPCYGLAEHTLAVAFSPLRTGMTTDRVLAAALARGQAIPVQKPDEAPEATGTTARQSRVVHVVSCGRLFPGHACQIVDADGQSLPERTVGEILLRGPSVMQGYFEDAEATATALRDGWLHTGDLGYLADGNLYVCGRIKDVIIVYGRNYHPQDLEWEAEQVEGIRKGSVIAFGFEDLEAGQERVVIAAETRLPGTRHTQLQLAIRTRILEGLGLQVDQVLLVPPLTLPKTTSGKPQRARSRDLFQSGKLGQPLVPTRN